MLKICICDDDAYLRNSLANYITKYSFQNDVDFDITQYDLPYSLLDYPGTFDIIFLDIEFGVAEDGIDIAKKLRKKGDNSLLVFITSHPDMSIRGYEAEAFRFAVKPLTSNKVFSILHSCIKKLSRDFTIRVKTLDGTEFIKADSIIYIVSEARKRLVILDDGNIKSTWQLLKDFSLALPPQQFQYVQKSYIVNLDKIVSINNNIITMTNGDTISLSRHHKVVFYNNLRSFLEDL